MGRCYALPGEAQESIAMHEGCNGRCGRHTCMDDAYIPLHPNGTVALHREGATPTGGRSSGLLLTVWA